SVPRATGTPASTISRPGERTPGAAASAVMGSSTAVTPLFASSVRSSARAAREASAAGENELFRVHLDAEPDGERRAQEALGLADGEEPRLAEDIAKSGQPFRNDSGERAPNEQVDVGVGARAVLGRYRVGAEERRHEPKARGPRKTGHEAEQAELALDGERVAGLHLDRGRAVPAHAT